MVAWELVRNGLIWNVIWRWSQVGLALTPRRRRKKFFWEIKCLACSSGRTVVPFTEMRKAGRVHWFLRNKSEVLYRMYWVWWLFYSSQCVQWPSCISMAVSQGTQGRCDAREIIWKLYFIGGIWTWWLTGGHQVESVEWRKGSSLVRGGTNSGAIRKQGVASVILRRKRFRKERLVNCKALLGVKWGLKLVRWRSKVVEIL